MHPDIDRLLGEVSANLAQTESFATLTREQFNWRPEPGRWSIGECISHLNVADSMDMPVLRKVVADARARGVTGSGPYRYGWPSRWFVANMDAAPKRKFKAPKYYEPPPESDPAECLSTYRSNCAALLELLRAADGLDLARVKSPMIPKWLKMPLGARFALLAAHDRRHLWQAAQVRAHPNFP